MKAFFNEKEIMKNFRKPYLSVLVALVFLFVSCSEYDMLEQNEVISIETIVENHIKLSKELSSIYIKQNKNSLEKSLSELYNSEVEFKGKLIINEFEDVDEIVLISRKIQANIYRYLEMLQQNYFKTKSKKSINQNMIINDLKNEIIKQSKDKKKLLYSKVDGCLEALNVAGANCDENYAISLIGISVSTFWTFGIGTVIGYGVATAVMIKCHDDAGAAYSDCEKNMNT